MNESKVEITTDNTDGCAVLPWLIGGVTLELAKLVAVRTTLGAKAAETLPELPGGATNEG